MIRRGRGGGLPTAYDGYKNDGGYSASSSPFSGSGSIANVFTSRPNKQRTLVSRLAAAVTCLVFLVMAMYYRSSLATCNKSLGTAKALVKSERALHSEELSTVNRKLFTATKAESQQDRQHNALQQHILKLTTEQHEWEREHNKREELWKKREGALWNRLVFLKEKIQRESRREAVEIFGIGPHHVKIEVDIPHRPMKNSNSYPFFIIELHPLFELPHSVHLFLEQVNHGLWDGCYFVSNAPHILQAGYYPRYGGNGTIKSEINAKMEKFRLKHLDVVSYQEYHPHYPHEKYTIGYSGRPGGPDFYINKVDNSFNHGPGGQNHHDLEEEADPCFGKVVDGFQVVDLLWSQKVDEHESLIEPVKIVKAIIMGDDDWDNYHRHSEEYETDSKENEEVVIEKEVAVHIVPEPDANTLQANKEGDRSNQAVMGEQEANAANYATVETGRPDPDDARRRPNP